VNFLLTAGRDAAAARSFFESAIDPHDAPEKVTIDRSGGNTASRARIDRRRQADGGVEVMQMIRKGQFGAGGLWSLRRRQAALGRGPIEPVFQTAHGASRRRV